MQRRSEWLVAPIASRTRSRLTPARPAPPAAPHRTAPHRSAPQPTHALGRRVLQDDPAALAAPMGMVAAQQGVFAPVDPSQGLSAPGADATVLGAPGHDDNNGWSGEYTKVVDGVTKTCHKAWYGTAPSCRGECPAGMTLIKHSAGQNCNCAFLGQTCSDEEGAPYGHVCNCFVNVKYGKALCEECW